jgi:LuxR family quorum-sensing system transcriptional regulator SinR
MPCLDDIDPAKILLLEKDRSWKSLEALIELIRQHYALARIVYTCPAFRSQSLAYPPVTLSYGAEPGEAEAEDRAPLTIAGDPAMGAPADWANLRRLQNMTDRICDDARKASPWQQGLTIPVRGPTAGVWALFSVMSYDTDDEWMRRRYDLMRDMVHVAHFVHQYACALQAAETQGDIAALGVRELEALKWAAEGLHAEDIGYAMRLSPETVRAYLDSARYKLKALSQTHAIIKAIGAGLIQWAPQRSHRSRLEDRGDGR